MSGLREVQWADNGAKAEAILREFMADIEAVGVKQAGKEWPDLVITYNKARMYFRDKEAR